MDLYILFIFAESNWLPQTPFSGRIFSLPTTAHCGGNHPERMIGMPILPSLAAISIDCCTWRFSFPSLAAATGSVFSSGCQNLHGNSTLPHATLKFCKQ